MQISSEDCNSDSNFFTRLSGTAQGIVWMLAATGGFVTSDTIAKYLLEEFPIPQVVWARYSAHFLIVVLLLRSRIPSLARTNRLPLQLFRSCLLILATISFFAALSAVPLATASAIMFTAPIMVTALSGPFLQEKVGLHRWFGVVLGFIGALTIVRPGASNWDPSLLWAVTASLMYALYQITTRALYRSDSSETTLIYTSLMGALLMSMFVPFAWVTPDPGPVFLMTLTGLVSGMAHYAIIKAFSAAPASVVTPFGYTNLIWATAFGYALFAEVPHPTTFIGAGIIVLGGIYIVRTENRNRSIPY